MKARDPHIPAPRQAPRPGGRCVRACPGRCSTLAFTLIELLVAIAIIGIIAALLWPAIGVIKKATGTESASNTVAIAVETARFIDSEQAAADRPITDNNAKSQSSFSIKWSGTAALFTASGEIRLLECDPTATSTNLGALGGNSNYLGDPNNSPPVYGYTDVPGRDYVTLPSARGVVGIIRDSSGMHLITPPFAVRFNKAGQLVAGNNYADYVYYSGKYADHGSYNVTDGRPDPYPMPAKASLWNSQNHNYDTAFDKIETVIGIVLFDPSGMNLTCSGGYLSNSVQSKIMSTGKIMLFNRYTGVPIRKLSHD